MGEHILITGGTSGLGLATARTLAAAPGRGVVVTGRGAEASAAAGAASALHLRLDLGSLDGIRAAVERLGAMGVLPLRALVANAGMQVGRPTTTADGFEATFGANHLGHVALIARLLDRGGIAPGGRIVLVASGTHDPDLLTGMPDPAPIDAHALSQPAPPHENGWESRRRYTTSKLANVMTAYALARRLAPAGITVNAFDPGLMPGTGLVRGVAAPIAFTWRTLMRAAIVLPGVSTPQRSSATLADLAVSPRLQGVTGTYWAIDRERRSSRASYDVPRQDALWRDSLELVGLEDPVPAPTR